MVAASSCGTDDDSETSAAQGGATTTAVSAGKPHTEASESELEEWQRDLNAVGCWAGAVDGTLGPRTEAAIEEFQAAESLTVDGLLGPATERALADAAAAGETVCTPTTSTTMAGSGSSATTAQAGGSTGATGTTVAVSSPSFSKTFAVTSCTPTQGGNTGVVLSGTADGGFELSINAPSGTGTIRISGGGEQDAIDVSGTVSRATVSDAEVNVSGTFSDGEAFTASGYCA